MTCLGYTLKSRCSQFLGHTQYTTTTQLNASVPVWLVKLKDVHLFGTRRTHKNVSWCEPIVLLEGWFWPHYPQEMILVAIIGRCIEEVWLLELYEVHSSISLISTYLRQVLELFIVTQVLRCWTELGWAMFLRSHFIHLTLTLAASWWLSHNSLWVQLSSQINISCLIYFKTNKDHVIKKSTPKGFF